MLRKNIWTLATFLFGEYIAYSDNLYFDRERLPSICTNEFFHSAIEGLYFNVFFALKP